MSTSSKIPQFNLSSAAEGLLGRLEANVDAKMKALFARCPSLHGFSVQDRAMLRLTRAGLHAPLFCRCLDQQGAAHRAGLAQRRPEGTDRG